MAKESMKAREVKRARMNARYAEKLPVIMKHLTNFQKTLHLYVCTIVAN